MNRTFLVSLAAAAVLAPAGAALGSQEVKRYNFENAWPSKMIGQKKGGRLNAKSANRSPKGAHVGISLGDGRSVEARKPSSPKQ